MVDVFRSHHGYGEIDEADVSFESLRFDHLFASKELDPSDSWYASHGYECSDHAPLLADFEQ